MFPPDRRRVIVLLTVKSHFSHFYRGQCRDFVISKKLSASVKWDLRAARPVSNVLNHENKIISKPAAHQASLPYRPRAWMLRSIFLWKYKIPKTATVKTLAQGSAQHS